MISFIGKIFEKISVHFKWNSQKNQQVMQVQNQQINIVHNHPAVFEKFGSDAVAVKIENYQKFAERIQDIPKERLTPIEPQKSITALQRLQYVTEEILSDMFVELLAKSADSKYSSKVRARYQEILSNLDSNDAMLLEFLFRNGYTVKIKMESLQSVIDEGDELLEQLPEAANIDYPIGGIPFLEIRDQSNKISAGWRTIHKIFTDVAQLPVSKSIQEVEGQMEHLASLGLIEIKPDFWFLPVDIYLHLENDQYVDYLKRNITKQRSIKYIKGRIDLTTLGRDFLSIVLKNQDAQDTHQPRPPKNQ